MVTLAESLTVSSPQAFCTTCVARITSCALDRQTIREVITVYK